MVQGTPKKTKKNKTDDLVTVTFKCDAETIDKLEQLQQSLKMSGEIAANRSYVIRRGIACLHEQVSGGRG